VTAQLIDAETGNHVWAERYDRDLADVFAVQDEITLAVTRAIGPAVDDAEQRRALRKPPESLGAWETYLRGQWHYGQITPADHERAKQFFQRTIAIDARFAAPYVALARAYLDDAATFGTRSLEDAAELSAGWARKAIAIDPQDADARAIVANAALAAGNAAEAREQIALARASNPNSSLAILVEAEVLLHARQPVQARQGLAACLRVDPRGLDSFGVMRVFAIAHYFERDYSKSVEAGRRRLARHPEASSTYRWLAAALGQLGRTEEARAALHKAIELSPQAFELYTRRRPPWHRPEDHEHMLNGLRKAGWQG
jgi:adenylate cyclase